MPSTAPHWQHWWAATDPRALMVDLSDPSKPLPAVWDAELASMILHHPGCVRVGHSLGAVLIARILTKWPQLKVRAAMLVAPAETRDSDRIDRSGPIPERPLGVPALVVASRNDPWMRCSRATSLARSWNADLVDMGLSGHINVASGFGPWLGGKWLRDELIADIESPFAAIPQRHEARA